MHDKTHLSSKILAAIGESYVLLKDPNNLKQAIESILPKLGEESCVDRAYVFRNCYNYDGEFCFTYLSEWCKAGISPQMDNRNLMVVPWHFFSELESELRNNQIQNKLVKDSSNEYFVEVMTQQNIVAYLFLPIIVNSEFWGFIGFDNCTREELFTPEQGSALHALATTLGNFIFAKRSLKRALRNEKKYKQIVTNIQDVVFKLDKDLKLTYLNGAWSKLTVKRIHDCIGLPLADFFIHTGAIRLVEEVEKLGCTREKRLSFPTAIKKPSGELHHVKVNLKKITIGNRIEFFGTIHDTHQIQVNYDLLKKSESQFKSLFDTVEDVLYSLDGQTGKCLIISDKIERFGFKKEEYLTDSQFWINKILLEDRPGVVYAFSEFLKMRLTNFEIEYRIQKSDGRIAWIHDKAWIECNPKRMDLRIHGRLSEITEQKNKEMIIEQTENRFKVITENLPFPMIICKENDCRLLYYNFSFLENFQSDASLQISFENSSVYDFIAADSKNVSGDFLSGNANFSNHEVLFNTKEGPQWFSLSSQSIPYKMESARAIVFYNINKRKLSELELIKLNDVVQAINQTQIDFSMDNEIHNSFYLLLGSLLQFSGSSFGFIGEVLYDEFGLPYLKSNATSNISWNEEVQEYYQKNFRSGMEFRNLDSLFGRVLANKQTIISNEVELDPRRSPHGTPSGHPALNRFLGIPIFKGDLFIGMVGLANKEMPYTQDDIDFLKPFLNSYANLIVSLNVNKQKRQAEYLQKESESLYRVLSENIDDIVTLHDLELKTVYVSPSLEKVTGFKPDQFIGKDFFNLFNFKLKSDIVFTEFPRFIIPLNHGVSGKEVKLEMLWKPIFSEKGELKSYLAASRDVTERELVLEELKKTLEKEIELNQLKSKFISMTSHELRTPMATIQSSADLMEIIVDGIKEEKVHEGMVKQIRKIHVQISRLTQIISEVLLSEKNSQGKLVYNQTDVDLRSLIIQLVFNQFPMSKNEPKIRLDLGDDPVILKSDPVLLFHVIRNLIENAIKYTPEIAPKPILKMKPMGNLVEIQFVDFGIGIPKEETKFVLETFFRAGNVKNIKGTGLGLSIVNDLVQKLGGKLTFTSIENQGSTFTVTIPYERNDTADRGRD